MARNVAYDSPIKEPYIYYPDKNWELPFMTKNPQFEDERGATMIESGLDLHLSGNYYCGYNDSTTSGQGFKISCNL